MTSKGVKRKWTVEELFAIGAFEDDDSIFNNDDILDDISECSDGDNDELYDISAAVTEEEQMKTAERPNAEKRERKREKSQKTDKFIYECKDCEKKYKSVSGFRGHMRKVHKQGSVKGIITSKLSIFKDKARFHKICNYLLTLTIYASCIAWV